MAVLPECRRRGVGARLLEACDEYAGRMDPKPAAIALHVDADNEAAIGLYQKYGYAKIIEREVDDAFGRLNRAFVKAFGSGKKKVLMVRWLGSESE
jgi:ribosomal protein S18 acetylase RimI-like enzyme